MLKYLVFTCLIDYIIQQQTRTTRWIVTMSSSSSLTRDGKTNDATANSKDDDDVIMRLLRKCGKKRKYPSRSYLQDNVEDTTQEQKKPAPPKKKSKSRTATDGKKNQQKINAQVELKQDAIVVKKETAPGKDDKKIVSGLDKVESTGSGSGPSVQQPQHQQQQQLEHDETRQIIDEQLQCPICYAFMDGRIYMCQEGHSICDDCRSKHMTSMSRPVTCPTCRMTSSLDTRNRALEIIAATRRVSCRHEGCGQALTIGSRKAHEDGCSFGYNLISTKNKGYGRYFTEQECLEQMSIFRNWNKRIPGKQTLTWLFYKDPTLCKMKRSTYRILARYKGNVVMVHLFRTSVGTVAINVFHYALPPKVVLFKLYIGETSFSMSGQAVSLRGPKMPTYTIHNDELCGMLLHKQQLCCIAKNTMAQYPRLGIKEGDISLLFHLFLFADQKEFDQFDVKEELDYMKPHLSKCLTSANNILFTYDLGEPRLGAGHVATLPSSDSKEEVKASD